MKNKIHLENNWIALEHKSKSDAMVLLKRIGRFRSQFKMISEQVVLSEQLVRIRKNNN
jgi:exonuclease SbcC